MAGRIPRASGGNSITDKDQTVYSPVFPAQAGVIPVYQSTLISHLGIPRASGGNSISACPVDAMTSYSPRKRG